MLKRFTSISDSCRLRRDIAERVHMSNMMVEPTDLFAIYKTRKYKLEYIGETKFGYRAKLVFQDGSKNFWVDANLLKKCTDTMTDDEMWDFIGEERYSMFSGVDSIYDLDPDIGDH